MSRWILVLPLLLLLHVVDDAAGYSVQWTKDGTVTGVVKFAVIAPVGNHEQSLTKILPVVELAVRTVSGPNGTLPGWTIVVQHRDSRCSSTDGPLAAFEFYTNHTAGHIL